MSDTVIIEMSQRFNQYQAGERVGVTAQVAEMWCGDDSPNFKVATRVPTDEAAKYFKTIIRDKQVRGGVTK